MLGEVEIGRKMQVHAGEDSTAEAAAATRAGSRRTNTYACLHTNTLAGGMPRARRFCLKKFYRAM
jgi:hypothetical protein